MPLEFRTHNADSQLQELIGPWSDLALANGSLFSGPQWLLSWWKAYRKVLVAELRIEMAFDGDRLVGVAPLYSRLARRAPGLKVREIRMLGDAGPRPPELDLLVVEGFEEAFGNGVASRLDSEKSTWDVLDLQPLKEPSRVRAFLANRLSTQGFSVESAEAGGGRRLALVTPGVNVADVLGSTPDPRIRYYENETGALRKGLATLRRLSRLEWADREETSPLADPESSQLLESITLELGTEGRARLLRLDDADNEAIAAALVIDDGPRAVVLATAIDPQQPGAAVRLLESEARGAAGRGLQSLDVVTGADEMQLPGLPSSRRRALRLRIYGGSRSAALARTYGSVRRKVEAAVDAPGSAAAGARAAWAKIRTAAESVVGFQRLHLYRGELWTRGIPRPKGLTLASFSEAEFDALESSARETLIESLELDVSYAREKWKRGDLTILARLREKPAGIAWSASKRVYVPELDCTLDLLATEAYIHDVYVAPQARGRAVAPSMLEHLSKELRARDIYRSWALIGRENVASIRAFEKATYTAVADIIFNKDKQGAPNRVTVRPPDPEALRLLGPVAQSHEEP